MKLDEIRFRPGGEGRRSWRSTRHLPARVKAFVGFLQERMAR